MQTALHIGGGKFTLSHSDSPVGNLARGYLTHMCSIPCKKILLWLITLLIGIQKPLKFICVSPIVLECCGVVGEPLVYS